jgi:hypothetical protein
MSVSLQEVLENAGYDVKNNLDDAKWLLGQKDEFEALCEDAEHLDEIYEEYLDCKETAEEDGDYNYPSFNEWKELNQ